MTLIDAKSRQLRKAAAKAPKPGAGVSYEKDFAGWAFAQAKLLRQGAFPGIDVENIAEELETLGRDEFNKLESALTIVVMHMLKWDYQPAKRSRSWANSIRIQRIHAARQIRDNPSLKPRLNEALNEAYETARLQASTETKLPPKAFPAECPYTWSDVTERPFAIDPDDA
jgi:hypothetical protein